MIQIKTDEEIVLMRAAGLVVGRTLEALAAAVAPGVTTGELDALAESTIRSAGAVPSFLGYRPHPSIPPFPGSICASVNDEIVHGIPGQRVLRDGDVISIDCGAILAGWHGDAAVTVGVGTVSETARELMRVTEESMWHGLAAARLGGRLTDISHAVESYARSQGDYGIVEEYGGHGIGTEMHQEPAPAQLRPPGSRPDPAQGARPRGRADADHREPAHPGAGRRLDRLDGRRRALGALRATVAVTERGPWVLTALDGGVERLAALGVTAASRS